MAAPPGAPAMTRGILKLARQIDAHSKPGYVPVEPGIGCLPSRCFENVRAVVRQSGGSFQHGWRMREQATAYVEGEFYAVWRDPEGALIDVTPRADGQTTILFLPETQTAWQGEDVESRRMMLHEQACYCGSGMPFKICHGLADE